MSRAKLDPLHAAALVSTGSLALYGLFAVRASPGCRPLLGWRGYTPVARAMAAAMPYIDCFAAANTLQSLGALEAELARL